VNYQRCTHSDFERQYVINGDSKNPSTVYIYDTTAKSGSAQTMTTKGASGAGPQLNPTKVGAILDHDTNIFCKYKPFLMPDFGTGIIYSNFKELFRFNITLLKSASPRAIPWVDV
jgi:hypothetical protein